MSESIISIFFVQILARDTCDQYRDRESETRENVIQTMVVSYCKLRVFIITRSLIALWSLGVVSTPIPSSWSWTRFNPPSSCVVHGRKQCSQQPESYDSVAGNMVTTPAISTLFEPTSSRTFARALTPLCSLCSLWISFHFVNRNDHVSFVAPSFFSSIEKIIELVSLALFARHSYGCMYLS